MGTLLAQCKEALIWCSGSEDFQKGGKARKGWVKLCKPLLDKLHTTAIPKNAQEIVQAFLKDSGFEGLVNTSEECGCQLDDLFPCGEWFGDCEPGYIIACDCGDHTWHIATTRTQCEEATETTKADG